MNKNNKVLILDFGSQTTHLIGRRLEEFGLIVKIIPGETSSDLIKKENPLALILSGGPASVYGKSPLLADKKIFDLNLPVLSICYGTEVTAQLLGGKVDKGKKGEYGQSDFKIIKASPLFNSLPQSFNVWMSHFDQVVKLPLGFKHYGKTSNAKYAAFADKKHQIYCVLFHPEVVHTEYGQQILKNFIFEICKFTVCDKNLHVSRDFARGKHDFVTEFIKTKVGEIKKVIGNSKAICALSGGVDSATAALLTYKAIAKNLICIYVDTGLMRLGETEQIQTTFKKLCLKLVTVKAEDKFLKALKGVVDPEEKRKAIGKAFIEVFDKETLRQAQGESKNRARFLIQGTIYPDVIESKGTDHSHKIKTHHNVGGLPQNMNLKIVEPLRSLYKDQVRELAVALGLPNEIVHRQIFPGPGLAVRIIGEVTKEKLDILRASDKIVDEEIRQAHLYEKLWMSFAILTGIKTTGVTGDERSYGETIAVRAITSVDTMTADWARLPYEVLAKISNRITTEVRGVNRIVYDITTKPPATMEWE